MDKRKISIPEDIVTKAQKIIYHGMGYELAYGDLNKLNKESKIYLATRRLAIETVTDAIKIVQKLGGKVVWEKHKEAGKNG